MAEKKDPIIDTEEREPTVDESTEQNEKNIAPVVKTQEKTKEDIEEVAGDKANEKKAA